MFLQTRRGVGPTRAIPGKVAQRLAGHESAHRDGQLGDRLGKPGVTQQGRKRGLPIFLDMALAKPLGRSVTGLMTIHQERDHFAGAHPVWDGCVSLRRC